MTPTKNNLIIIPIDEDIVTDAGIILHLANKDRAVNRGMVFKYGLAVNDGIRMGARIRNGLTVQYFKDAATEVEFRGDKMHIVNKAGVFLIED